ncbi:MAG: hypothetical protein IPK59_02185 [Rhodospirillaceae bacterium]|nr:hypothetical protein [Rhodospirillaceae bacterium]
MRWGSLVLVGLALGACTPDNPPQATVPRPVYSEFGIDVSPYAYGNPSPYGYANAWSQPTGASNGYLGANRFSPRQGLMCEHSPQCLL